MNTESNAPTYDELLAFVRSAANAIYDGKPCDCEKGECHYDVDNDEEHDALVWLVNGARSLIPVVQVVAATSPPVDCIWDCIQREDGYSRVNGMGPCGAFGAHEAYLRTATADEAKALARVFRENLLNGYWKGRDEDEDPVTDPDRLEWFGAVSDFMQAEDGVMTDDMYRLAGHDGCKELAAMRGWCPCEPGGMP